MHSQSLACQSFASVSHTQNDSSNCDHWKLAVGLEAIGLLVILSYALSQRTIPSRMDREDQNRGT